MAHQVYANRTEALHEARRLRANGYPHAITRRTPVYYTADDSRARRLTLRWGIYIKYHDLWLADDGEVK